MPPFLLLCAAAKWKLMPALNNSHNSLFKFSSIFWKNLGFWGGAVSGNWQFYKLKLMPTTFHPQVIKPSLASTGVCFSLSSLSLWKKVFPSNFCFELISRHWKVVKWYREFLYLLPSFPQC